MKLTGICLLTTDNVGLYQRHIRTQIATKSGFFFGDINKERFEGHN